MAFKILDSSELAKSTNKPRSDWLIIFCFVILIGVMLLAHAGKILAPVFPISAVVVGAFLQQRNPPLYIGFTWWLWFLSPLVKRMIDYYAGTYTYGPWTFAAMLVTSLSIISLFRHGLSDFKGYGKAIIISAIAVLYGSVITYIESDSRSAVLGTLNWLSPIAFCFYLQFNWKSYPEIRSAIQKSFIWAMPIMGSYGIYQYMVAPAWDCFYLNNPGTTAAFGTPEPFGIRTFSTMEAPHSLGACIAIGVYLVVSFPGNYSKYAGLILGLMTLLLTSARTVWVGFVISLLSLFPSLSRRKKLGFIALSLAAGFIVYTLAMSDPFSENIIKRFDSFQDAEDSSFVSRKDALANNIFFVLLQIIGKGFASTAFTFEGGVPVGDNGVFLLIFSLGILGAITYVFGIFFLVKSIFSSRYSHLDAMIPISKCIIISTIFQSLFVPVTEGVYALILWTFIGLSSASARYFHAQKSHILHEQKV